MTFLQRVVYALGRAAGILPRMPAGLVEQAAQIVREVEATHRHESAEYRRHLVYRRLVQGGSGSRAAAIAIEIAVHKELR